MSFIITITESKEVTKTKEAEYTQVGERLVTEEEAETATRNLERTYRGGEAVVDSYERIAIATKTMKEYGYPPNPVEVTEKIDTKVYEQVMETIDLKRIILAINGAV